MVQKSNRENIMITGGECVGCRSCEQVCPTGCIVFKPDEEGFLYPKVEEEQCIRCGKCLRHCPVLFRREEERQPEMACGIKMQSIAAVRRLRGWQIWLHVK